MQLFGRLPFAYFLLVLFPFFSAGHLSSLFAYGSNLFFSTSLQPKTSSSSTQHSPLAPTEAEDQPLFLQEEGLTSHGKKHWYDYLIEADPGACKIQIAPDYEQNAPQTIAVLPFLEKGSGKFSINGVKIDNRDKDKLESWRWTIAQRVRRVFYGFLASREFEVVPLSKIDHVLQTKNIRTEVSLQSIKPEVLGKWLGADALVYGEVFPYQRFYMVMGSGIRVVLSIQIISSKTGKVLFSGRVNRNLLDINPRFDPVDIGISSVLTLTSLRDINLKRAEDEACRELVLRIPLSPRKAYPVFGDATESAPKAIPSKAPDTPIEASLSTSLSERDFIKPPKAWAANEKKLEPQRFFLEEKQFVAHSKKKTMDYVLEMDPSRFQRIVSPLLAIEQPKTFALLPFVEEATKGKFILNGIPLSFRSKEKREQLRWTIANRLRRGVACYLAQRDLAIQSIELTDSILKAHGWKKLSDMLATDPITIGDWLGVDCVIYGKVSSMMSIYSLMYAACRVGLSVQFVSTKSSKTLVEVSGSRTESSFAPAFDPLDIAISSLTTALLIRDVTFRRAEDEVCREIAARLPSSMSQKTVGTN
ncbi:hypothetical protein A946_03850 [Methylacidiphilum kamchatkense Kam1]|uniref:Lipoprotein DUF799 n=1 Tax=Methylacidiphilum kamchatkense Kam1 TaxID=1202785 RepID=A0ABR4ZYI5_9BACT|nr:hypothetical protein A946_03850 [Methylacidiphilum kamchatkense Kam1]